MAAQLPSQDVLGVFRALKDDIQQTILQPRGLSIKSAGTKFLSLGEPISVGTGFWQNPNAVSSKPPRWIPQVEVQLAGVSARFASDANGNPISMGRTVGYINNRDGTCAVCAFRVMPSVKASGGTAWQFPPGWEYLLLIGFQTPLPAGTSGDPLGDFNPVNGTIDFGGGTAKATYQIGFRALVKVPVTTTNAAGTTYDDVGQAIAVLAGATIYNGTSATDRDNLVASLQTLFATAPPSTPFVLAEDTSLVGISPLVYRQIEAAVNSGKRHIILYGPPGTGKTTLAEYLAREVSDNEGAAGAYIMLTASSAWSAQDLVGGYQPLGGGSIGFISGALLRNFDKPVVIDEFNRCPVDKVFGPMFSILSGQSSVLPCRVDVADPNSPFHTVLPKPRPGMATYEHAPEQAWRLICTLNTYDKTQLGQLSYALSRRFAWIKVGAPENHEAFVIEMAIRSGITVPAIVTVNPVGLMWKAVNAVREVGGAPIIDFIRTLNSLDPTIDMFTLPAGAADNFLSAFRMCVLPLMDGLSPREAADLAANISAAWALDTTRSSELARDCQEFST